jgi:two-component system response regulator NreC
MDKTLKVIIADDHMIVRDGLRSLLERQPDMEVVAEADNGRIALKLVKELSPDVVIMDIGMRELNGIDATRQIVKMSPGVKVLALSMYSDKRFIKGMLKAGASGYMLKDSAFKELIDAIRVIVENKIYISPSVAKIITEDYLKQSPESDGSTRSLLSSRELEVLQLLVEGMSTKQIASSLRLSIKTIESHRSRIMKKIDINNIADLTRYAIRAGIISLQKRLS